MKHLCLHSLILVALFAVGCSSDKGKELFDTAQLEEKQSNPEHAKKLYEEIVAKYQKSPAAQQAQERLNSLRGK